MYIYMHENRIIFLNSCKIKSEFMNLEINSVFCFALSLSESPG